MRAAAFLLLVGCYAPTPPAGAPCPDGSCPSGLVCSPATMTCELTVIDAAVADDGPIDAPPVLVDSGVDAPKPYLYRRAITIHNNSNATLPAGFTIRLSLGSTLAQLISQNKVRADLADLRVIGDGSIGERDRIVDGPLGPAPPAVSFSLAQPIGAGATSTSYALYYGGSSAPAPADGSAVFALYDEFTTGIASFWLRNDAPTTSGGMLVLRAGHTDAVTTTASTDGVPVVSAVELVASVVNPQSNPTSQPEGTFYYWFGYQHTGDFDASDPWAVWIARGKGAIQGEQKSPAGCAGGCEGPAVTQNTASHYYAIERDPTQTRFYRDGAQSYTAALTSQTDYSVMIRNYMATSDLRIEWIRARARVSPDPSVTLANEENL